MADSTIIQKSPRSQDGGRFTKTMKFFGLEFAPLYIPFERRLQTLAVFTWMSLFLFMGLLTTVTLIYLLYTDYKWMTYLYIAWMAYDWNTCVNGGRNFNFVRRWRLWRHFANFFPMTLVKTTDLDPNRSYLFGSHPHGLLCAGAFCAFGSDALNFSSLFPGLQSRLLTLRGLFCFPGYRELFLSTGSCAASKKSMENLLRIPKGQVTVLVVGGALEAANSDKDCLRLVLERRKGFIKLALRFGVDLVPTFSFGEYSIYGQIPNPKGSKLRAFQDWFENHIGFTPVLFFGRGVFQYNYGFVPYRKAVTIVVGKPIKVERIADPTTEDILKLHSQYSEALKQLYEEYNPIYGDTNLKLVIE